jgi:hypothetical protein
MLVRARHDVVFFALALIIFVLTACTSLPSNPGDACLDSNLCSSTSTNIRV